MRRIAIITLTGYFNFGNRLQNYALQEVLNSYGFSVDIIKVGRQLHLEKTKNTNILNKIKKIKNKSFLELFNIMLSKTEKILQKRKIDRLEKIRTNIFKDFTKEYINESDYFISEKNIPVGLAEKYDFFVVGSDQVWNPHFNLEKSVYFLNFVPKSKRIAYSPSFGVSEIPEKYVDEYQKGLLGFDKLTIRERSGAVLIKKLTGKESEVLVDPTMLLDKEEWLKIAKEPKYKPGAPYILNYFLGKLKKEDRRIIKEIARKNKYKIIDLGNVNTEKAYIISPSEFIHYIKASEIIFTDSFHGAVFSILFKKPFIVFKRNSSSDYTMETRFDNLLSIFNLENRKISNIKDYNELFNIDYSNVYNILESERNKSQKYLKDVLKINF